MANRSLGLAFWRVLDALDYWLTLTRLRVLDALCGAELVTPADDYRGRSLDRLKIDLSAERPVPPMNQTSGRSFTI
jgi:hypothetical protein